MRIVGEGGDATINVHWIRAMGNTHTYVSRRHTEHAGRAFEGDSVCPASPKRSAPVLATGIPNMPARLVRVDT